MTKKEILNKNGLLNFVLVGVGGQGTILASNVLAALGMQLGYDVKKAEVHGMSQRGGSVTSHLRWGNQVFSSIVPKGEADILVAFEKLEAVRFASSVRRNGLILVNDYSIIPMTVMSGAGAAYPNDEQILAELRKSSERIYWIDGQGIAESLENVRIANVVLLGALSAHIEVEPEVWLSIIESAIPLKYVEINRKAFMAGRETIASIKN